MYTQVKVGHLKYTCIFSDLIRKIEHPKICLQTHRKYKMSEYFHFNIDTIGMSFFMKFIVYGRI